MSGSRRERGRRGDGWRGTERRSGGDGRGGGDGRRVGDCGSRRYSRSKEFEVLIGEYVSFDDAAVDGCGHKSCGACRNAVGTVGQVMDFVVTVGV